MDERFYCLWLSNITGVGARNALLLLDAFKSAQNVWNASHGEIISRGFSNIAAANITDKKNRESAKKLAESLEKKSISFIAITDERYPSSLKSIYAPPTVLYTKGELPDANRLFVSVIGTRKCSEYGARMAYSFAKALAEAGVVVVSGMAEGIDSIAHRGALAGCGKTVAVLGSGVDICYPAANSRLMEEIMANGCVLSEYPPGTRPMPGNFPARNRIISGLSKAVLVVEAGERSGTLITVDHALEQGRDVFAIPGNVTSVKSSGTNALIRDGATLVESPEALLAELDYLKPAEEARTEKYSDIIALDEDEKTVYDYLWKEPQSIDALSTKTGYAVYTLQYILTCLEIKGIVQRLPGNRYVRN